MENVDVSTQKSLHVIRPFNATERLRSSRFFHMVTTQKNPLRSGINTIIRSQYIIQSRNSHCCCLVCLFHCPHGSLAVCWYFKIRNKGRNKIYCEKHTYVSYLCVTPHQVRFVETYLKKTDVIFIQFSSAAFI